MGNCREFERNIKLVTGMVSGGAHARFDNPGVCFHIYNAIQRYPKYHHSILLRTFEDLLYFRNLCTEFILCVNFQHEWSIFLNFRLYHRYTHAPLYCQIRAGTFVNLDKLGLATQVFVFMLCTCACVHVAYVCLCSCCVHVLVFKLCTLGGKIN